MPEKRGKEIRTVSDYDPQKMVLSNRNLKSHLNKNSHDALKAHGENGRGTFLIYVPVPVTDGMLRLHGEQETRHEAIDIGNAGLNRIRGVFNIHRAIEVLQITVCVRNEPPN